MSDTKDSKPGMPKLRQELMQHWQALGERERLGLQWAGAALGVLLLWTLALQPALRTLREAPAKLAAVDAELQQMQALASETRELRDAPPVTAAQALQALRSASDFLGPKAKLTVTGDRAVLSFNGLYGDALQNWLSEVRSAARARPVEAQMQRGPQGFNGSITLVLGASAS